MVCLYCRKNHHASLGKSLHAMNIMPTGNCANAHFLRDMVLAYETVFHINGNFKAPAISIGYSLE